MKPRHRRASLTDEDIDIWDTIMLWSESAYIPSTEADRRDADLMLEATENAAVSITLWQNSFHVHEVWWEFGNMGWYCGRCCGHRATRLHHELCQ